MLSVLLFLEQSDNFSRNVNLSPFCAQFWVIVRMKWDFESRNGLALCYSANVTEFPELLRERFGSP